MKTKIKNFLVDSNSLWESTAGRVANAYQMAQDMFRTAQAVKSLQDMLTVIIEQESITEATPFTVSLCAQVQFKGNDGNAASVELHNRDLTLPCNIVAACVTAILSNLTDRLQDLTTGLQDIDKIVEQYRINTTHSENLNFDPPN